MSPAVHLGLPGLAPRPAPSPSPRAARAVPVRPAVGWSTVRVAAPRLAAVVEARLAASERHVLATMTVSGAPRVSGTGVDVRDGELVVPVVLRSPKGTDLLGDPRCVLHSNPGDGSMTGDVKITGRAADLVGADGEPRPHGREPLDVVVLVEVVELSVRDRTTGEVTVTRWTAPEPSPGGADAAGPVAAAPEGAHAPGASPAPGGSSAPEDGSR